MAGLKKDTFEGGYVYSSETCATDALFDRIVNVAESRSLQALIECRANELKMSTWLLESMLSHEMKIPDISVLKAYQLKEAVHYISNLQGLN